MKRSNILSISIYLTLTGIFIIIFNSCLTTNEEDTFSGKLKIICKLPSSYSSGTGCCSDSISSIHVSVYYGKGFYFAGNSAGDPKLGPNNSIIEFGDLWPGKYKVVVNYNYKYKVDHSLIGPCGNCNGGSYYCDTTLVDVEIITNQSKIIVIQ